MFSGHLVRGSSSKIFGNKKKKKNIVQENMQSCSAKSIRRDVTIRGGTDGFISFVTTTINHAMEKSGLIDNHAETLTSTDYISLFSCALRATAAPNLNRHYREMAILVRDEYKTKPAEDVLNDAQLPAFIEAVRDEIQTESNLTNLADRFKRVFPDESSIKDKLNNGRFIVHTIMYNIMGYLKHAMGRQHIEFTIPNVERFLGMHQFWKYCDTLRTFADSIGPPGTDTCYSTVKILTIAVLAHTLSVHMGFHSAVITNIINNTITRRLLNNIRTASDAAAAEENKTIAAEKNKTKKPISPPMLTYEELPRFSHARQTPLGAGLACRAQKESSSCSRPEEAL